MISRESKKKDLISKDKKRYFIIMSIFLLVCLFSNTFYVVAVDPIEEKKEESKIILIDPGHGGFDGGAVTHRGTVEKDINLKIGLKLKEKLVKDGFKIVMTREEDKALCDSTKKRGKKVEDLNARCKMKKDSNCSMFISIHLNMFPQSQYYGAQVWYAKDEQSKKIADLIQESFRKNVDNRNDRVTKAAKNEYKILRCDNIPSVIVECGFLSNAAEEEKLRQDWYQEKIADSIATAVKTYYNRQ